MATTLLLLFLSSLAPSIGAWQAKKTGRSDFLIAFYVMFTVLSQIFAAKIALFDFGLFEVTAPSAVLIFAVTFLITDIVNEKFGRTETLRMVFIALAAQVVMILFLALTTALAPAPFWSGQEAWSSTFLLVPRITVASLAVFFVTETLDAYLYQWFRKLTKGRHLWARSVFSSIPALTLDTILFVTLAFWGTGTPLWPIMVGQFATKWIVGVVDVPLMYFNRWLLGVGSDERQAPIEG